MLTPDKVEFRAKKITGEAHYIIIKDQSTKKT